MNFFSFIEKHPTQPLELISIQSDNSEFYFSERNFPAEIMPFKKIEIPFYFLPHVKQDESFLLDEGREDSELGSRFHHSATFQVICDLTFSEFSISVRVKYFYFSYRWCFE